MDSTNADFKAVTAALDQLRSSLCAQEAQLRQVHTVHIPEPCAVNGPRRSGANLDSIYVCLPMMLLEL